MPRPPRVTPRFIRQLRAAAGARWQVRIDRSTVHAARVIQALQDEGLIRSR